MSYALSRPTDPNVRPYSGQRLEILEALICPRYVDEVRWESEEFKSVDKLDKDYISSLGEDLRTRLPQAQDRELQLHLAQKKAQCRICH